MGGATGLRYEGVRAGLEMSGEELTPEVFQRMQILEVARLSLWGDEAKRDKERRETEQKNQERQRRMGKR